MTPPLDPKPASVAELKPCPFCGGEARRGNWATDYVKCTECWAEQIGLTPEEAISAWNHRSLKAEADAAEIAELREKVEEALVALDTIKYVARNCIKEAGQKTNYELASYGISVLVTALSRHGGDNA